MRGWIQIALSLLSGAAVAFVTFALSVRIHPDVLTDDARMRLEMLSFYLVSLMVISFGVMVVWNRFGKTGRWLPRLEFGRTMKVVGLCGVLFWGMVIMVVGGFALLMPGEVDRRWALEWIREDRARQVPPMEERREAMEHLRDALWAHAAEHGGRLPGSPFVEGQEFGMWRFPAGGFYVVVPGGKAGDESDVLMYEPATAGATRLVLLEDGRVESLSSDVLRDRVKAQLENTAP